MKGFCNAIGESHIGMHEKLPTCDTWGVFRSGRGKKDALVPYSKGAPDPDSKLAVGYKPAGSSDEVIQWLQQRVEYLERELAGAEDRYKQLNGIYQKLADQWNAYQATAKPDNRNVHRAEAAGELARKLGEALIGLAYDKDARRALTDVLDALRQEQDLAVLRGYLPEPR